MVFPTAFGLAAYSDGTPLVVSDCSALGFGTAGSIDLNQEAEVFCDAFEGRGTFVRDCASRDIQVALESNAAVLISCHGNLSKHPDEALPTLRLSVRDGAKTLDDFLPAKVSSDLAILSACSSGAYEVAWGDYPSGAAPEIIRRGARYCIASRCQVGADFAARFMSNFAKRLSGGEEVVNAFSSSLSDAEGDGADLWRDLACFELLGNH